MTTKEFISQLRVAPQNRLLFLDAEGRAVHAGCHLTELKAASFNTVDCGGQINRWDETIVQLWVPADSDGDYMSAGKFLKIFDKVRALVPLKFDAEIRVEYGDEKFFPSTYHVNSLAHERDTTRVLLEPPAATCKARDRRDCCGVDAVADRCCATG
jgi:hypothetical protein